MTMTAPLAYLAIDMGASSSRAVLGVLDPHPEGARMRMAQVARFRTPMVEKDGHLYWDIGELWSEMLGAIRKAVQLEPSIRSISIDSWAVDYVSLDANGVPLALPFAYRDPRTKGRMAEASAKLGADRLYARTGLQSLELNTLPQILAELETTPAFARETAKRVTIADYFLSKLSGVLAIERTMASTTQLYDVTTRTWAVDLITEIGDDPARWPAIVEPGTVLGALATDVGIETTTLPRIVAGCSHDTAAAVAAIPAHGDGPWAYLCLGTWALIGAELNAPILDVRAREEGFTNETGFGGTIRFLKNRMGMWILEECLREWSEAGERPQYDALFADAARAPSMPCLIDVNAPAFAERGDMVANIGSACRAVGMQPPSDRGALVRLLLESVAESYARTLRELDALTGAPAPVVHMVGGAIRHPLVNQLIADACNRRVVAGPDEATALGNLLVQASALGDLPPGQSVRDVARRSTVCTEYTPTSSSDVVLTR